MERELIVERTLAGLAAARAQGRIGGRRPKLTKEQHEQIARLIKNGHDRKATGDHFTTSAYRRFIVITL
ncbi:hypothetical protein ACP0HM_14455 [Escherichia coli]